MVSCLLFTFHVHHPCHQDISTNQIAKVAASMLMDTNKHSQELAHMAMAKSLQKERGEKIDIYWNNAEE